ncbi:competence type IV pilus minor pilin ComGF [Halobacillus seohaensis]|uniref:Competence type IV pilus minor pilin ComGF n=1 Tax=Halobacillus seohaensis TaxID=447421 RepID=A0ABW2EJM4_9BACI
MKKISSACMLLLKSNGFTLVETIISLTLISILLTISVPVIKLIEGPSYSNELSVFQFLTFVEEEINTSTNVTLINNELIITDNQNREIKISKYGNDVRRRVNNTGHELLIHNIQELSFKLDKQMLHLSVVIKNGGSYHKTILYEFP